MLEVFLFGHARLTYDGKSVPLSARPKVVPLLGYLLLNCRRPISRDSLAFALWPDDPEAAARANLRRHLHYLRDILPQSRTPWFIADPRTVCWNPAARMQLDVADFERSVADSTDLEKAVSLYSELLHDYDDEWVLAPRERLRRSYVQALFELARRARGRRDSGAASDYLERILADDPWREDALRAFMTVRCESGDRSSALQLCAEFEQRLKGDMGAALMPETIALRYAIERGNPLPAVPLTRASPSQPVASAELPFEGRDQELVRLRELWERTISGSGAFALIVGEAGIGKSRLASEFALAAEVTGARVFWGTTSTPETVPYQAVTEVTRAALGLIDLARMPAYDVDVLARLLPELREGETPEDPGGGPDAAKLYDVVGNIFLELGRQRPALFVLEDLHGGGRATVAMLEHIVQHCCEAPVMILLTLREGEPSSTDTLSHLRRQRNGLSPSIVPLAPLSESAVLSIIQRSLRPGVDASAVAARSAGHPLFLAELLYAAIDSEQQVNELPTRLREMIDRRSRQVSAPAALLLRAAAVVGNAFDLEVVAETVGWSESRLSDAADELIARRIIRQTPSARSFEYEFAHDLIASAAYESSAERERRRWHRRAARAAEHLYASRLPELSALVARHFELGGEHDYAAAHYLRAARRAASAFANNEALGYAKQALDLKPRSLSDRYEALCLAEDALALIGDRAVQRAVLSRLHSVARKIGDDEAIRDALRRLENLQLRVGEHDAALRTLDRLYQLANGNARWETIALRDRAVLLNHRGRKTEALEAAGRATARAAETNDDAFLSTTLVIYADIAASLGRREDAERCLRQAKSAAESLGSIFLTMRALFCEMLVLNHFQVWPAMIELGPRLLELATTIGSKTTAAAAHTLLGGALGVLFDIKSARNHFRKAIELYRGSDTSGLFYAYNNLATIEIEIGRFDNAHHVLDEIDAMFAQRSVVGLFEYQRLVLSCELATEQGEFGKAITLAENAIVVAAQHGNAFFEAAALRCKGAALRATGNYAEAISALERSYSTFRSSSVKPAAARSSAELSLACAMAADERAGFFADETLASIGPDPIEATSPAALWLVSQTLSIIGRIPQARVVLVRAHDAFEARRKLLRDRQDRAAFSQMPENVELERAYALAVAGSAELDAKVGNPRARRVPKTRTAPALRPREQSL